MTDDVKQRKRELRSAVHAGRAAMAADDRVAAGLAIAALGQSIWADVRCIAAYLAVGQEPPTAALLDGLRAAGTTVLLPVIDGTDLDWAPYDGMASLAPGPLGISEPTGPRRGVAGLVAADVVLVPALAVDRLGRRLGRGRGYYDRALATTTGATVAVVYDDELIEEVPTESHDRTVAMVLRPSGITRCDIAN